MGSGIARGLARPAKTEVNLRTALVVAEAAVVKADKTKDASTSCLLLVHLEAVVDVGQGAPYALCDHRCAPSVNLAFCAL